MPDIEKLTPTLMREAAWRQERSATGSDRDARLMNAWLMRRIADLMERVDELEGRNVN